MHIEFEATFLKINKDKIREKLKQIGAKCVFPERMMKRVVFNPPIEIKGGWMRVRDEGDKITMSLKIVDGENIEDQKEVCLVIDSMEKGVEFLKEIGAEQKSYQETLRESWKLGEVEFEIDTWPGLNPFLEIEGPSEEIVKEMAEKLGFNYNDAHFGAADVIYQKELGIPMGDISNKYPVITFEEPPVSRF